MRRWGIAMVLAGAFSVPAVAQNTVRWNDVMRSLDDLDDAPPAVSIWLDNRVVAYGAPVRIGFRVEEDAFVVIGRVDGDGRLTVLFPAGRTRAASVKANEDNYVRSARYGSAAAFLAVERPGASGFVFALSSRTPMDLSRLTRRDFSSWVTGTSLGQPASRYLGDPYRVIQRFARVVSYSENSEFDYDVEFYSVDLPRYVTASTYSNCAYAGYWPVRFRGAAYGTWWNRGLMYDEFGTPGFAPIGLGCGGYFDCLIPAFNYGWGVPYHLGYVGSCGRDAQQVATSNPGTVPPPLSGTDGPVNPWVPDSIGRPNVDKSGNVNGPHVMTERPAPVGWSDREDLSFSIPSRALRGLRTARREEGSVPISAPGASNSGPIPMPSRPTPEVAGQTPIEWVRPPRSFDAPPRDPVDRMPSLGGRRQALARGSDDMPDRRGGGRTDWGPPPRVGSPMFERDPGSNSAFQGFVNRSNEGFRGNSGGGMYMPPMPEGRPAAGSPIMVSPPTSTSGASAGPPASSSGTSAPPASGSSTGEKKPPQPPQ